MIHRLCTDYLMRGRYTDKVRAALADVEVHAISRKILPAQSAVAAGTALCTQKAWRTEWTRHNQINSISEVPI